MLHGTCCQQVNEALRILPPQNSLINFGIIASMIALSRVRTYCSSVELAEVLNEEKRKSAHCFRVCAGVILVET
jgi:hypothetical protein